MCFSGIPTREDVIAESDQYESCKALHIVTTKNIIVCKYMIFK